MENSHSEEWLFSKYHSGFEVFFMFHSVNTELSFGLVVIFLVSFGF